MGGNVKKLMLGAVPLVWGSSGAVAQGENISWPEVPSPRLSFQATTLAAVPTLSPEEAHAERIRREARQAELDALIGRQRVLKEERVTTYGIRP